MIFGKKLPVIFSVLLVFPFLSFSQDHVGSGRALQLDGVDDYVNLGNIYDNVTLPVTVSAWVKLDPSMPTQIAPIFVSQDNSALYNGFWLGVSATTVFMEYGDGFGENNPAYRRGKSVAVSIANNQWVHVCGVMRSAFDISIYINGISFGGSPTGDSYNPMSSNFPSDVAKIGYLYTNGVTHHLKGMIDEVRVWNRSLSQTEVRDGMCKKLKGNETGLIGYWTFDETTGSFCDDASPNNYSGSAGGSQRVFSGAPVGDESAYLYPGSWTGNSVSLTNGTDKLQVNNIQGFPTGVHVYAVNDLPSQTSGLPAGKFDKPYMGVFAGTIGNTGTFDAAYYDNNVLVCQGMQRRDNSVSSWSDQPLTGILKSTEIMKVPCCVPLDVDLGVDQNLCDVASCTLQAPSQFSGMDFLWSNGATTPSITVSAPGDYWLKVGDCTLSRDTVSVDFQRSPSPFSLGQDEKLCAMNARFLSPFTTPPAGYDFTWQDGSKNQGMLVMDFGKYWLKVTNICGSVSDTVTFSEIPKTNITVDLGDDVRICDQGSTTLSLPADFANKTILWSTGSSATSIVVSQSKSYAVKVSDACASDADTVAVTFLQSPPVFSFGDDEVICHVKQQKLRPVKDPRGLQFEWQDGSTDSTFVVQDFGEYWVKVSNVCGTTYDNIRINKLNVNKDKIPNVITPGNDLLNENFVVEPGLLGSRLTVFNRWGERVYDNPDYQNNWNGDSLSSGVYFYILQSNCIGQVKGNVSLVKGD